MTENDPYSQNPQGRPGPQNGGLPEYPQPPYGEQPFGQQPGYPQPGFGQQPGYPQPGFDQGYQQPGYQQPGYPQPGFGAPGFGGPVVPTTRPGTVLAAAIVLIGMGALILLLQLIGAVSSSGAASTLGGAYAAGYAVAVTLGVVLGIAAVGTGVFLLQSRKKLAAIVATVVAGLLLLTCWGIVATIAVPILLWVPEASKAWFTD